MALEFMGVAAQRVGFAQVTDDPAILVVINDRKCFLRRLAEPVECSPKSVSREQERGGLRNQGPHGLDRFGAFRATRLGRVDYPAESAAFVYDENLLGAAGWEAALQLVDRQFGGDDRRVAPPLIQPTSSGLRIVRPRR